VEENGTKTPLGPRARSLASSGPRFLPVTTPAKAKKRHDQLVAEIRTHDYRYYVLDDPAIGDREYDALYAELRTLQEQYADLRSVTSPTQRVGDSLRTDLRTVPHVVPMMSLDNTYDFDELAEFERRVG